MQFGQKKFVKLIYLISRFFWPGLTVVNKTLREFPITILPTYLPKSKFSSPQESNNENILFLKSVTHAILIDPGPIVHGAHPMLFNVVLSQKMENIVWI